MNISQGLLLAIGSQLSLLGILLAVGQGTVGFLFLGAGLIIAMGLFWWFSRSDKRKQHRLTGPCFLMRGLWGIAAIYEVAYLPDLPRHLAADDPWWLYACRYILPYIPSVYMMMGLLFLGLAAYRYSRRQFQTPPR